MASFREVPIEEATPDELREFCDQENLPYAAQNNGPQLRALIQKAGYEKPYLTLIAAKPADIDVQFGAETVGGVDYSDPDTVDPEIKPFLVAELQINNGRAGETAPVDVDVDGSMMRIPRNRRCEVPYRYFEALCHAKQVEYAETDEGLGEGTPVHSYPHQLFRVREERDPGKLEVIKARVARMKETDKHNMQEVVRRRNALEAAAAAR